MKINEKYVGRLLEEIWEDLEKAYRATYEDWKDTHTKEAQGKIKALLTIIDFE